MPKIRLVYGIGINDAGYVVQPTFNGRRVWCPFYAVWKGMLLRCYSPGCQEKHPTYTGCTVTPEWHSFSAFRAWMITQDYEGKDLDKDILFPENKVYSPDTCIFISKALNRFLCDAGSMRGDYPIGVFRRASSGKFVAQCSDPFTGRRGHIGCFDCPDAAHQAWLRRKHQLSCQYADTQADSRIAKALRERFITTAGAN